MTEALLSIATTEASTYDARVDVDLKDAQQKGVVAHVVVLLFIIAAGLIFNTVALTVFIRSPLMRRTNTARYLMALSVADSIYLIGELLKLLNISDTNGQFFHTEFAHTNMFWCAVTYYLRYYGRFVSCWLTVAITIERYIGIALPLRVSTIATKIITTAVIVSIYVIGACLNAFPFWVLEVRFSDMYNETICTYKDRGVYHTWNWAVLRIGSLMLPCGLILVFTVMIIYNLRKMSRERRQITSCVSNESNNIEKQLTLMLIVVALTTLLLRLPHIVVYPIYDYRYEIWGTNFFGTWGEFRLRTIKDVCFVISVSNYAVNFFIFCLSGSVFRKNLIKCLKCRNMKPSPRRSQYTKTTLVTSQKSNSNSNVSLQRITQPSPIVPKARPSSGPLPGRVL